MSLIKATKISLKSYYCFTYLKGITFLISLVSLGFNISANTLITRIPFTIKNNWIFIKVRVDGSEPQNFMFDTGAGTVVLNSRLKNDLHIPTNGEAVNVGAGGKSEVEKTKILSFEIGDIKFNKKALFIPAYETVEEVKHLKLDGVIGWELFKNYVVKINYRDSVLEFFNQKDYKYTGNGLETNIKFKVFDRMPLVKTKISLDDGNSSTGWIIVDTGADNTIEFKNLDHLKDNTIIRKDIVTKRIGSEGKEISCYSGTLKGKIELDGVPVKTKEITIADEKPRGTIGTVGNAILKDYNLVIDYKRNKLYWELLP